VDLVMDDAFATLAREAELDLDQLALVREVTEVCRAANAAHHAPGELADVMLAADRARSRLEAQAAVPTAKFATASDWAFDGARTAGYWLAAHTKVSRPHANSLIATARLLGECPHIAASYRAGRLGAAQVRLLLAVRLPVVLEEFTRQEAKLVDTVEGLSIAGTSQYLAAWFHAATDGDDPRVREDKDRNHFSLPGYGPGRRRAQGDFDAEHAAIIQNALDAWIKAAHADGGLVDDTRSLSELQAEALTDLVARGSGHARPARPSVSVLIDHDTLVSRAGDAPADPEAESNLSDRMPYRSSILGHGPVAPEVIRRMCCNADITRIVMRGESEPLDVGRNQRLATLAIRQAVWARSDGWCELCHHTRLTWCQLHHLTPWDVNQGAGETSVENSLLVCSHCHHLLHEGGYQANRTDTGFQLLRPDGSLPRLPLRHRPHPDTT
jgi:hypothetical protein